MTSALTHQDEIQVVLPPLPEPAPPPVARPLPPPGALGLGMLADIAASLASSLASNVAESFAPDGRPAIGEIEWQGGELRRFARLLQTPAYEAWLIAWEAAADLELHDHGGSQGAFHVVEGTLVEAHTDLADPAPLRTLPIGSGEGRQVTATRVHRVWNPEPARAVSVHVYSPPLSSMTFYDDRPGTFLARLRTDAVEGAPESAGAR
jgi:hypothetical protein